MRTALAIAAFLFAALSFGLIGIAFVVKLQKFRDPLLALKSMIGIWPNTQWLDVLIIAISLGVGTILFRVGLLLLKPPT